MLRHPEASFLLSAGRRQKRKELHRMRHGAIEGRAHGRSGGGGGEIWLKIKSREGKGIKYSNLSLLPYLSLLLMLPIG